MTVKVININGLLKLVHVSELEDLAEENRIVAYKIHGGWVELRRRQVTNPSYRGAERRKSHFVLRTA
ncbi:MAG TPA: hypothetical protein VJ550_01085 [Geomonas sp.]|nr:hypothetical protein [Geomonas sp.]